jgi:hypothetical protein
VAYAEKCLALMQPLTLIEPEVTVPGFFGFFAAKLREVVHGLISVMLLRKDEFKSPQGALEWVKSQDAAVSSKAGWKKPLLSKQRVHFRRHTPHGPVG